MLRRAGVVRRSAERPYWQRRRLREAWQQVVLRRLVQFVADEHDVGCYAVIDRTDNNADAETTLVSPSDFLIQFHV